MRISATGHWNRREGFTLVELAVVLVILGVVATLVLPRLGGFGRGALDSSSQRLALTIKSLYNEAALRGETHLLVIQVDQGRYEVHRLVSKGEVFEEVPVGEARELGRGVAFRDIWVQGQGTVRSGEVKVRAYPVGWMEETVIHLRDGGERVTTLHVPSLAGMADIYDEDRSF